jgi:hypothetical protein
MSDNAARGAGCGRALLCDTGRMRRAVVSALAGLVTGVVVGAPVHAARAAGATIACTVADNGVVGLSGLAVTPTGYIAISDSNSDRSRVRIWFLDRRCRVSRSVAYPTPADDPEDLAVGRDGTLYVADIGDNQRRRSSIAVWRLAPGSSIPHLFRYAYPDRPHDAEAMLLAADDSPIFVTKDPAAGHIYVPVGAADPTGKPVRLRAVGTFTPTVTSTPNGLGMAGEFVVTGGANSPDRRLVALRTYAAAYVWPVPDGDVVKAVTTTAPRIVPLPGEAQGESIAFDPSGTHLYTVSDREQRNARTPIRSYSLPADIVTATAATPLRSGRPPPGKREQPTFATSEPPAVVAADHTPYRLIVLVVAVLAAGAVGIAAVRRRGS